APRRPTVRIVLEAIGRGVRNRGRALGTQSRHRYGHGADDQGEIHDGTAQREEADRQRQPEAPIGLGVDGRDGWTLVIRGGCVGTTHGAMGMVCPYWSDRAAA